MERHSSSLALNLLYGFFVGQGAIMIESALTGHALRPQSTRSTHGSIKDKAPGLLPAALTIRMTLQPASGLCHLPSGTRAGTCLKISLEVFLGKMGLVRAAWYFGYESTLSIDKGLPGSPIPVGTIPDSLLHIHARVVFALLYQF